MRGRIIVLIMSVLVGSLSAGLVAETAPRVSTVQAKTGLDATNALTHLAFLPVVMNCYPRPGPDPYFVYQYDMSLINADAAWGLCNLKASGVTIAVIDTGVDLTHPDLQANLLPGYDFVNNDAVPQDNNGHGTNVAGIAAAALNGIGVAGVAPTAKILPVRVLNSSGSGYLSDIAAGITYAADRAQVLNLSLGGPAGSQTLLNAINYAVNTRGRLVVAAAGNCGDNNYGANGCKYPNQTIYPAAYANVLAVAATTSADTRASFSNVDSYVGIAAPGDNIYNTYRGSSYAYESGTSQATPHVSGLAALVWAKNPGYTAAQVWNQMASTAVDLGTPGFDSSFGAGRIDVAQALSPLTARASASMPRPIKPAPASVVDDRTAPIAAGRIIVKFKTTVNADAVSRTLAGLADTSLEKSIPVIDTLVVHVPMGTEWKMVDQLRAQADVEYAEPDYIMHFLR